MTFKDLLKLTQKKHRREMGLCIIEGEKLVREHRDRAVAVFRRTQIKANTSMRGEIALTAAEFDRVSGLLTPEGVLAVVPVPKSTAVTYPYLVLDEIQDPGNVGTILRTAKAFGFDTVFCLNCADVWSQKVIRAAMGAQFGLNIYDDFDYARVGGELFIADMPVAGGVAGSLSTRASSHAPADANPNQNYSFPVMSPPATETEPATPPTDARPFSHSSLKPAELATRWQPASASNPNTKADARGRGLVLGNEGGGVGEKMRALPHKIVSIPQKSGVESLNVAVAGGIIMHEWSQQMVKNQTTKG